MPLHQFSRLPVPRLPRDRRTRQKVLLAATAISIIGCGGVNAADGDANEVLLKKLEKMEQRIQTLEAELKEKKQTAHSDKSAKSTAAASPKNANAAVPLDQPLDPQSKRDPKDKPASKSRPLDASAPAADKPILGVGPAPVAGLSIGAYREIKFGAPLHPPPRGP